MSVGWAWSTRVRKSILTKKCRAKGNNKDAADEDDGTETAEEEAAEREERELTSEDSEGKGDCLSLRMATRLLER